MNKEQPPCLHCDRPLARRLERAEGRANAEFVEARAQAFPDSGATWTEVAGTYAMYDGVGSPCTQTFGLGLFDAVTGREMEALERFFLERGSDVFHEVSPLSDPSVLNLLHDGGYRPIEFSNVLVRRIEPGLRLNRRASELIQVRGIGPDEHELWAHTASRGWADTYPELRDFLLELAQVNVHRPQTYFFLAQKATETIAAAALSLFEGVCLLAGACTVPEWRQQGAQLALLEHRLRYGAHQGCDVAMIVALPGSSSQRNAERQDFRVAYTRLKWRREAPDSPST